MTSLSGISHDQPYRGGEFPKVDETGAGEPPAFTVDGAHHHVEGEGADHGTEELERIHKKNRRNLLTLWP